jgi:hypothetical protein
MPPEGDGVALLPSLVRYSGADATNQPVGSMPNASAVKRRVSPALK